MQMVFYFFRLKSYEAKNKKEKKKCGQFCMDFFLVAKAEP